MGARNGSSCAVSCVQKGLIPVGEWYFTRNRNSTMPFYVCRVDSHSEGMRAGYNLEPSWAATCTVEWGHEDDKNPTYDCLCN